MSKSVIVTGEKTAALSYGDCINRADLIVLGEYKPEGKVLVKSVLKGNSSWIGKTITLPQPVYMGCRNQPVPNIKNAALLLDTKYLNSTGNDKQNSIIEIYDTPDHLAFLEYLVPIYSNKSENAKLSALGNLFVDPKSDPKSSNIQFEADPAATFKKEFLWAIRQMREPVNFEIVKKIYLDAHVDAKEKLKLQEWIAETRDSRAVPILIEALQSKDRWIVSDAVTKLIYFYPSKAVDEALKKSLSIVPEDTRPSIVRYFESRKIKTYESGKIAAPTPYQHAMQLEKEGKSKEAISDYLSILESKESNGYILRASALSALKLNKNADAAVKERILKARASWLNQDAATGNYLEVADTAEILRKLQSQECLDGLKAILTKRDFMFNKANRTATMAILELGPIARRNATDGLLKELENNKSLENNIEEQTRWLLEFAWLKQSPDYVSLSKTMTNNAKWSSAWSSTQALLKGLNGIDEGAFLISVLKDKDHKSASPAVTEWIVYRLGDLRDARASDVLLDLFTGSLLYAPQTIIESLAQIGGARIIPKLELIAMDQNSPAQASAIEILANCQHEKSLPLMRKLLKTGKLDAKVRSLAAISRFGNCDDWKTLNLMVDYWKGERNIHYWVLQAMSEIDLRCHCSLQSGISS